MRSIAAKDVAAGQTAVVRQLVHARYAGDGWVVLDEVGEKSGLPTRFADCVAVGLWKSNHREIHGIEIKASRHDWLRELKTPEKAAAIMRYCDYWWVAVAREGIVKPDELPPGWGLLIMDEALAEGSSSAVHAQRLYVEVKADRRVAELMDREFLGALLRRARQSSPEMNEMRREVRRAGVVERQRILNKLATSQHRLHTLMTEARLEGQLRAVPLLQRVADLFRDMESGVNLASYDREAV